MGGPASPAGSSASCRTSMRGPETGGGQIMMGMVGRTHSSADAVATATLMVTSEDGTYLMPRPTDLPLDEFDRLAAMGREGRYAEIYEQSRIRIAEGRTRSRGPAVHAAVQQVVVERARPRSRRSPTPMGLYMTILFAALGEEFAYFFHDDKDRSCGRRASPSSAGRRAAISTTTSRTAGSGRSTRSRRTTSRSASSRG